MAELRWSLAALALALSTLASPRDAIAQSEKTKTEARERFDRGLTLFNQGDDSGALAEFQRAYELIPHPLVLYNLALVYSAMRRPVDASDALGKLLEAPGSLDAQRLETARRMRAEQLARVGEIQIASNVEGAAIEVDGVEIGRTPAARPVRVASGSHIVGLVARGYLPSRRAVSVAGGARTEARFELVKAEASFAQLVLKTRLLDGEVWMDGHLVGRTPLAAPLAVEPGRHDVELRRAGYVTKKQSVELGPAARGEITLEPSVDPAALASQGGLLALDISERQSVVFIDGEPQGTYARPLRLPLGRHRLRIERANFFPFERDVEVAHGTTSVEVDLQPTPEYRASYVGGATSQRTWGWVSVGGGGLIALGSIGFLIWNAGEETDAEARFDKWYVSNLEGSGTECDPTLSGPRDACLVEVDLALENLESVRSREKFGWIGLGVGAVAAGFGTFLLLSGNDPDRYEPKPESDVFGTITPRVWFANRQAGIGVSGTF